MALIVTALSIGTILVYLYESEYRDRRDRINNENQAVQSDQQPKQGASGKSPAKQKQAKVPAVDLNKKNVGESPLESSKNVDVAPSSSENAGLVEPSTDELDSSISVVVFDPTEDNSNNKAINLTSKNGKKTKQHSGTEKGNKNQRQKRQVPSNADPSAEQLFSLIAACNLSKEEIELAVETLLNKSSNPDWKHPKSDPLNKIKNKLEQTRLELTKQQMMLQNRDNQINKAEKANQALAEKVHDLEIRLKNECEEKMGLLRGYELTSKKIGEQIHVFEEKLHKSEVEVNTMRSALSDVHGRLKNALDANSMLEKSLNELQLINSRQEEMLIRLREERHVNEASMQRTLCEMEEELRDLQGKLSANSATHDDRLRRELNQVEREQKLMAEMRELREGLSDLLPDLKAKDTQVGTDNWVHHYLGAVKHLAKTVEELRSVNNNNNVIYPDSPSKQLVDKSTLTPIYKNGLSQRVGSPTSNGRASKAGSHKTELGNDKKAMETKLLEVSKRPNGKPMQHLNDQWSAGLTL